jgi:hypothetical protein
LDESARTNATLSCQALDTDQLLRLLTLFGDSDPDLTPVPAEAGEVKKQNLKIQNRLPHRRLTAARGCWPAATRRWRALAPVNGMRGKGGVPTNQKERTPECQNTAQLRAAISIKT